MCSPAVGGRYRDSYAALQWAVGIMTRGQPCSGQLGITQLTSPFSSLVHPHPRSPPQPPSSPLACCIPSPSGTKPTQSSHTVPHLSSTTPISHLLPSFSLTYHDPPSFTLISPHLSYSLLAYPHFSSLTNISPHTPSALYHLLSFPFSFIYLLSLIFIHLP